MRDNFAKAVINQVAARVNYVCSRAVCCAPTSGPQIDSAKSLNLGVAAHISAASPGGPRYNPSLTPAQRTSHNNAIWLCQNCAKLIDDDESRFTENELKQWKRDAEARALVRIGKTATAADPKHLDFSEEELIIMISCADRGDIFLLASDEAGSWVRSGTQDLIDVSDPAFAAHYVEALNSLCQSGLVRHAEGILYKLTGRGFAVARALKQKQTEEAAETPPPIPLYTAKTEKVIAANQLASEYLDPVLELMHFGFDDVGKNERGAYVRVGKNFAGEVFKAAVLDFRLKPVRDGVPWVEAQANILFKDLEGQRTRVSAGIWLGRDQPKVPIRPGETQSLILTGGYSVADRTEQFSTYEHGPRGAADQRIERPLQGDVKVCVGIVAEYMNVPRSDNAWYFGLYKMDNEEPWIAKIKPTAFDKRLRLSKRRTSM